MPRALITGMTGQDGPYLAKLLLERGYEVMGLVRPASTNTMKRIHDVIGPERDGFAVTRGDLLDSGFLHCLLHDGDFDEVYNLAALSDVAASYETPDYAMQVNALGATRLLEAVSGSLSRPKFYQASTSELFGDSPAPQSEITVMRPMSPYACAKLAAFWMVRTYRDAYGLHASNGILFNHESPHRGGTFVTQKVAAYVAAFNKHGYSGKPLSLGNLESRRDWSHAADMVRGMWMMLQQSKPGDYVLASGVTRSVRELVDAAFQIVGERLEWDLNAAWTRRKQLVVRAGHRDRPIDVPNLCGDPTKARETLGWEPQISFHDMLEEMIGARLAD